MKKKSKLFPIILCGGTGTRLWPLSRRSFPKQYLSLDNEKNSSFLQVTIERIRNLENADNPIIICNEEHRFITAEQLRQINIKPSSIILEPSSQNTAPSIAIAALKSISEGYDPILLILPSDHQINSKDKENFLRSITKARDAASDGNIVTFGIKPINPATGFGYIKSKYSLQKDMGKPCKIEEFIEKPNIDLAKEFFLDNRYSWNSGIYMAKASILIQELQK